MNPGDEMKELGPNGKPMVFCGRGDTFKRSDKWDCAYAHNPQRVERYGDSDSREYCTPSNSETARLNGWGDFKKPKEEPKPPPKRETLLDEAIREHREHLADADKELSELRAALAKSEQYRDDLAELLARLEGQPATHDRAFLQAISDTGYRAGRQKQKRPIVLDPAQRMRQEAANPNEGEMK